MPYTQCPECGGKITVDKITTSGRDIRDYDCLTCGWGAHEDRGPALWTMMSSENDDLECDQTDENLPPS